MAMNRSGRRWQRAAMICRLFPLFFWALTMCGFTWGGLSDSCAEATNALADSQTGLTDELAERAIGLCPNGAVGYLAKGFQFEYKGNVTQAIKEYRKAIAADPNLSQAHGNLGLLLLQQGADDDAATELSKALTGTPDPRYHRGLAELLNKGKWSSLLLFHAREAMKGNPDNPDVRTLLGDALTLQGNLELAEKEYTQVLAETPGHERAHIGLAAAYTKKGQLDDAIRELNAAALANPASREIHRKLADLYQQKGEMALADKELQLAGLNPDDAYIDRLMQQGDRYLLARNYEKAIESYEAVLKKRQGWAEALEKLGDAQMAAGRDEDAISAYGQVLALDAANPSLHYTLGILNERKGLLDKAEDEYRKSLHYDPKNSDARRRLADIYTLRGNFAQSIEEYTELIKLRGDNPILHFRLARVYEKSKDYKKAIAEYLAAVRLAPDNLEVRKELAALYGKRGMIDEAEGQYQEVLRIYRDDKETRNALLSIYVKQKNYDGLLLLLKEAVEHAPDDANNHFRLGIIYDFRKEYDNAAAEYQKTLDLNVNHAKALNAFGRLCIKTGDIEKAKTLLEAARIADPNLTEPRELLSNIREDRIMRPVAHRKKLHKGKKAEKRKKKIKTFVKKKQSKS